MTNNPDAGLEELSESECWRILAEHEVGRLAVCILGKPDIFPVNYRIHKGTVLVRTAAGLKLAAATLGSAVAFEVDVFDETNHTGDSVVVRGPATEVERLGDLLDAKDAGVEPWAGGSRHRYVQIVPEQVTGRRIS